jgi:hypothetical protein
LYRGAVAALAAALTLVAPAIARASSQTATLGPVTATLSYQHAHFEQFKNVRLAITRNGTPMLDQDLGKLCDLCTGAGPMFGGRAIHVQNLDGAANPEPEVYVDLWTGGVHCCEIGVFYRLSDDGTHYEGLVHDFGNAAYRRDSAGDFITADNFFYEAFTAFAVSGAPIQVLHYDHGALDDVTRSFPAMVRRDLKTWRRLITRLERHRTSDLRGVVAPYVADECLLGRCAAGLRVARRLAHRGYFSGRHAVGFGPRGSRYVRALKRLLHRRHYD